MNQLGNTLTTKLDERSKAQIHWSRELSKLEYPTPVAKNLDLGGAPKWGAPDGYGHIVRVCYRQEAPYKRPRGVEVRVLEFDDDFDPKALPKLEQLEDLADFVNKRREHASVYVHCRMGMNRSGLITALALIRAGKNAAAVIEHLRNTRSSYVLANPTFEKFIRAYPKVEGFYDGTESAAYQARQLAEAEARWAKWDSPAWDDEAEYGG
jgi:hypothetical protein